MKKLILILVAFGVANIQAMETKYGIGYSNKEISSGSGGQSIDWDNIELSYYVSFDNNFAAEFSLSTGIKDNSFVDGNDIVKYEGDTSYFLKGIYNINDTFYISGIYADAKVKVTVSGVSASAGDEDFGFGLGANFQIPNSENIIRVGFESFDFSPAGTDTEIDKLTLTYLF